MSSSWLLPRSVSNSLTAYPSIGEFPLKECEIDHHGSTIINSSPSEPETERGMKDDLSEIKNSLAKNLRGIASFLSPPPQTNVSEIEGVRKLDGIRSDIAEIGGKVKAGISKILQAIPDDGEDYQPKKTIGVTEELLAFVRDLVSHPHTWVRFPLPDDANADDFALNDTQQSHVGAVERQIPELGDLRWELCPEYLSEGRFWMIYFVLVHSKLDKYDALNLSSPQIVEARALLTQESKNRRNVKQTEGSLETSDGNLQCMEQSKKGVNSRSDIKAISEGSLEDVFQTEEEDVSDDWLNEETSDVNGTIFGEIIVRNNEEEVSFSDLEEEDTKATKGNK